MSSLKNAFAKLPRASLLGLGTLAAVLVITYVSKRFYEDTENNPVLIKKGADLLKQAAEWTFSSQQTENPLLALTHATYAMAYLNLARNLASDSDLSDFTKIPVNDLREDTQRAVKEAKERVLTLCPQAGDKGRVASFVGYKGTGDYSQKQAVAPIHVSQQTGAPVTSYPQYPQYQQYQGQPRRPIASYPQGGFQRTGAQVSSVGGGFGSIVGNQQTGAPVTSHQPQYPQYQQQQYPTTFRSM